MKIYLGADHGGYEYKEELKSWLIDRGYSVEDCGAFQLDKDDDYPDFALIVAQKVSHSGDGVGVLLCRSGGGMSMAANKVVGVRAVEGYSEKSVVHSRTDNDANVLTLAGDYLGIEQVREFTRLFLETEFGGEERHVRRITRIKDYES